MTKPMVHEYNVTTGEAIEREMTDEEYSQYLKDAEEYVARKATEEAEAEAKAETKASAIAKLAALGLTEDEAAAIAGA